MFSLVLELLMCTEHIIHKVFHLLHFLQTQSFSFFYYYLNRRSESINLTTHEVNIIFLENNFLHGVVIIIIIMLVLILIIVNCIENAIV